MIISQYQTIYCRLYLPTVTVGNSAPARATAPIVTAAREVDI